MTTRLEVAMLALANDPVRAEAFLEEAQRLVEDLGDQARVMAQSLLEVGVVDQHHHGRADGVVGGEKTTQYQQADRPRDILTGKRMPLDRPVEKGVDHVR